MRKRVLLIVHDNPIDPLGVMYLISNTSAIYDVLFISRYDENILSRKSSDNYDIVGFSTITGSHLLHNQIAGFYKRKNPSIVTIMGGPHPTFFPHESLKLLNIDCICVGEGVVAFKHFLNEKPCDNIIYKGETDIKRILLPLVDINTIKSPDREVVYSIDNRGKNPIRNFMGMFGCPYDCSYCYNKSYHQLYKNQPRLRFKDPELFINEIRECVDKYSTRLVYIQDDTFIINRKWFYNVSSLMKNKIHLPYHCHIRCDIATKEDIEVLKDTGCKSVTFAIETADEVYRKQYLNRNMTNSKIMQVADWLKEYDIKFRIENMVGLPNSSFRNDLDTLKLNIRCKPTVGWASLYQPYPNTKLGEYCKRCGVWDGVIDNIKPSFFETSVLSIENKQVIERFQKVFAIIVKYPFMKVLLYLPFDWIYKLCYKAFKTWQYHNLF